MRSHGDVGMTVSDAVSESKKKKPEGKKKTSGSGLNEWAQLSQLEVAMMVTDADAEIELMHAPDDLLMIRKKLIAQWKGTEN